MSDADWSETDTQAMARALELARRGLYERLYRLQAGAA